MLVLMLWGADFVEAPNAVFPFEDETFPMSSMLPLLVKGLLIAAASGGLTHWLRPVQFGLLAQLAAGVGTALASSALLIFLFNVSNMRTRARAHLWKT